MAKNKKVITRQFDAEVGKVLQLMIHSLYTKKEIFLRELISNASDACVKILQQPTAVEGADDLKITVKIDQNQQEIILQDNGIGMDEDDLVRNLGTIAHSGTQRFIEEMNSKENNSTAAELIGQFGVGFYASFIVADKVTVISRKLGSEQTYEWQSDGIGEYTVRPSEEQIARGTVIKLHLKNSELEFLDKHRLRYIITSYSDHISFPIMLIDEEGKEERVNSAAALWTRNKDEISSQEYEGFFQKIAHMPGAPWLTLHNKLEGTINYTSLLYIPHNKHYDLFHPDRNARLKLYVKRVFICEEGVDLLPNYMRFIQGIVDCEDLPLNISRETLQHNPKVMQIKKSIVKKVISSLKKESETQHEGYKKFWQNFGEVIKEGLCEGALTEKEQLLEICRFYTTKSADNLISLDQYISNMHDLQENIFFITGNNLQTLRNHPQLEGFIKRDIEVLLLTDNVDDFWVNVVPQYKNKELCSVTRSNINLDQIKALPSANENDGSEPGVINETTNKNLVEYCQKILGDRVMHVKVSEKLVDSPASLALPEGAMSSRMERYLIEQKQLNKKTAKILEINPHHILLQKLQLLIDSNPQKAEDIVEVIFAQACLAEGEPLDDPFAFNRRIANLLQAV